MQNALHIQFERNTLTFSSEGYTPLFKADADFWRLHLDFCQVGKNNELGVYSHAQTPAAIRHEGDTLTVHYDDLLAEDGNTYPIALTLTVRQINGALEYAAEIDNRSKVRVNELQYPLFEIAYTAEQSKKDVLYLPMALGQRVTDPLSYVQKAHTEYMAADYKNVWRRHTYPGQMSMPWICLQNGDHTLALSRRDETCRISSFVLGTGPREEKDTRLIMTVSSYPTVLPGETLTLEGYRLAVYDTDWREEAASYRAWSNRTYLADIIDENGRIPHKESIKPLHGWQRIILKHQYGEIFHTYHDLPRIYREGAKYGIRMILLFAWWQEGMDSGYPNYRPDEELGGADALRNAIREINELGGKVVLYANGHLVDVNTDYYRDEGWKYTMKNIEMQEYREYYNFSNNGTMLRYGGLKTFVCACLGTPQWRDKVEELAHRHLELGSGGTFFDQLSCGFRLCFDRSHDHGDRIDVEPQFRVDTVKRIREMVDEDQWFGSERSSDRISPLLDFTHGIGPGTSLEEGAYPYLYRYTFPEVLTSNRMAHDEKAIYRRELNYAFIHGLLFDVGLYRCRIDTMNDCPNYSALIKKLTDLRQAYLDFFTDGIYDLPSIDLPQGIRGVQYTLGDRKILALWNDSCEDCTLCGTTVPAGDVAIAEL